MILYPLILGIINSVAFLAVYAADGNRLSWNSFFVANFYRWDYIRDHFMAHPTWSPDLGVAIFAGLAACLFAAMIRAPYFRAIAGMGYPRAPRNRDEAVRLSIFYVFSNLILTAAPVALPGISVITGIADVVIFVILVLIVFADYIIVFDQLPFLASLRRSARFVWRRWLVVAIVIFVLQFIYYGVFRLYDAYYSTAEGVFILLPLSLLLVQAFLTLVVDLIFIFMYQQTRSGMR
ncbi:MAG: hypothetical protein M1274_06395 [Actinobacteria bacterium]|nr:hypothetical protein [Actinomycetota bacterium]